MTTAPTLATAALITIDVQRDTLDGGTMEVPGTSAALVNMAALCDAFRAAARPIVHIVRLYLADGTNAEPARVEVVSGDVPVFRPGTPGRLLAPGLSAVDVELDDELLLAGGIQHVSDREVLIFKSRWGAFYRTPLAEHLDSLDVTTLVFAGCNFPNCPRTSMYEASERDYEVVFAHDATSGVYQRGLDELTGIGVRCATTTELLSQLE